MKERPTSITVISWILIVMGGISLITTSLIINNPMAVDLMRKSLLPVPVQFAMMFVVLLINITSSIAMLKGQNWGRLLYVTANIISFAITAITSPMKMMLIPSFILFLIVAFFLFRPKANEFFSTSVTEPPSNA
jgi:hypothetical protein